MKVADRISLLRKVMSDKGYDWYFFTSDDFHGSEYVADYFKIREYYSGFTGENAFLLINKDEACLWTDGRFFIQAEKELSGSGIELMKMGEPSVPSVTEYISSNIKENQCLAFDGRMISSLLGQKIEKILFNAEANLVYTADEADILWNERPPFPQSRLMILNDEITGESFSSKLARIRECMKTYNAPCHFLSSLDDIAWITNIRGKDVECNPVYMSYMFITMDKTYIFMEKEEISDEIRKYFSSFEGVEISDYNDVLRFLAEFDYPGRVLIDEGAVNYSCIKILKEKTETISEINPSTVLKAKKNDVEIRNLKKVFIEDSVAVTKFIYWLKNNVNSGALTEISASEYLDNLRSKLPGFLDLSFPTISGYGSNGAIVHYGVTKASNAKLENKGFLLVDSGGQYLNGTTDVTRTIALGEVSEDMQHNYTDVLVGMLSLADAKFLKGCTGRNLDILARKPLWERGIDFKHGTGHGVGYILNVHEGPQNIRWKYNDTMKEYPLEPGMVTSDEPGVYIEGQYGIRIENCLLCVKDFENEYGEFLKFEHLTYVPVERDAILTWAISKRDKMLINHYNNLVYEKLYDYLSKEEREWLREVTLPI